MNKYTDIAQVSTSFASSKNNAFYQCELKMRNGSLLLLKSQHYRGLADFEDRNKTYSEFVIGLHKLLALANPEVVYKKGVRFMSYVISMLIFAITGILFPIFSIGALITGNLLYGIIGFIGSIFLILKMVKYAKKNKPGTYDPDDIPRGLLPVS